MRRRSNAGLNKRQAGRAGPRSVSQSSRQGSGPDQPFSREATPLDAMKISAHNVAVLRQPTHKFVRENVRRRPARKRRGNCQILRISLQCLAMNNESEEISCLKEEVAQLKQENSELRAIVESQQQNQQQQIKAREQASSSESPLPSGDAGW